MQRRALLLLGLLPLAHAEAPRVNLIVELRWVESSVSGAALAGVREGGVTVGTAGSVGLKPGGTTASTRADKPLAPQALLVLNGQTARLELSEVQTLQWLEFEGDRGRARARMRGQPVTRQRGFSVTPAWPGGKAPVRVEVRALEPGADGGQHEMLSTVQLNMGEWLTLARRGDAPRAAESGTVRSSDAEQIAGRELQLRVMLAP
ncbi:MAG TPA: hypothetical protein VGE47_03300 [Burkholderiaceae bacterium]